jgi:hypothetical protein
MPTFTLNGVTYEYLQPGPDGGPAAAHSWEYGSWPRVEAAVPLVDGGAVTVHAEASRWAGNSIHVRWADKDGHFHGAWVPKGNVRQLTASEWDIIEFHACPEYLRHVRWGSRLPGFLPEA